MNDEATCKNNLKRLHSTSVSSPPSHAATELIVSSQFKTWKLRDEIEIVCT